MLNLATKLILHCGTPDQVVGESTFGYGVSGLGVNHRAPAAVHKAAMNLNDAQGFDCVRILLSDSRKLHGCSTHSPSENAS